MNLAERNRLFLKSLLLQKQLTNTFRYTSPDKLESSNIFINTKGDQSIEDWSQVHNKALILPQLFPSQAGYGMLKEKIKNFI